MTDLIFLKDLINKLNILLAYFLGEHILLTKKGWEIEQIQLYKG
jgi:hypothetical protein